jgi:hypothetical protein
MTISSDFKMVIVIDASLPVGLQANTAAVLSLSIGKNVEDLIGQDLEDKDSYIHAGLTKIPLPILKCSSSELRKLYDSAYQLKDELLFVDVSDAAQTTKNYEDYQEKLKETPNEELLLLGVAIAGSKKDC